MHGFPDGKWDGCVDFNAEDDNNLLFCIANADMQFSIPQVPSAVIECTSVKASRRAKKERTVLRNERNLRPEAAAARHIEKMTQARKKKETLYSTSAACRQMRSSVRQANETVLKQLLQKHIHAACIIQHAFRKHLINRYLKRTKAATLLQAAWRGRRQRTLEAQWHTAARMIQVRWRYLVYTRTLRVDQQSNSFFQQAYLTYQRHKEQDDAAIVLQTAWHRYKVQKWQRLVVTLKAVQMIKLRTETAVVVLQSAWRGRVARLWCTQLKERLDGAATTIQECWRAYAAKRLAVQNAAATLQAVWKGRSTRMQLKAKVRAAVVIQTAFKVKYGPILKERHAAVTLQARWRGRCQRVQYNKLRAAAMVMQKATRGWLARKDTSIARLANRCFAVVYEDHAIQSEAATVFQKVWRGRKARVHLRAAANSPSIVDVILSGMRWAKAAAAKYPYAGGEGESQHFISFGKGGMIEDVDRHVQLMEDNAVSHGCINVNEQGNNGVADEASELLYMLGAGSNRLRYLTTTQTFNC